MKLATSFGNGADSTFFAALSGAVSDMAGNLLQEVPTSKGVAAGYGVVADSTPPTLDAFVLDLDGGALSLAFDEPVTRLSLDLTKIVLSADEDEDGVVRLSATARSLVGFDLESAGDYNITLRFDEPVASNTLDGSAWYLQRKSTSTYGYVELKGLGAPVVAARTLVAGVSAATRSAASDSSLGTSQSSSCGPIVGGGGAPGNASQPLADGYAVELGPRVLSYTLDMDAGVLLRDAYDEGRRDVGRDA
ncbi:hypothetical protein JL721_11666 [Aureococcus anophagefferens]|nr:hypothetical protein JL721_11666 [Aureococcus anophagefferens]